MSALTSSSGGPDDNDAQAGHLIATHTHTHTHSQTFQKVIRSGARDVNGDLPPEVWATRDVAATLNLNDLGSESRAVELVVTPTGGAPNSNPPGRRAEDDVNLVAFQPQAAGDNALSIDVTAPCLSKSQLAGVVDSRQLTETTVRRLTPVECERLQGFPDNHTATSNGKTQADSPRYKQMGNAVAVPVFDWVFGRIDAVERGVL